MKILEFFIEKLGENEFNLIYKDKSFKVKFTKFFYRNLDRIKNYEIGKEKISKEKYEKTLELTGEEIRLFLFQDEIKDEIENIFREAEKEGKKIVIKINSDSADIHNFPFELIRYNEEYLLKKPNFFLVRDVPSVSDLKRVSKEPKEKLKILVLISLPLEAYENSPLDLLEEIKNIYSALEPEINRDNIEIYIEEKVNINTVYKILEKENFDIVHFTGHGTEGGYLVFEDEKEPFKEKLVSIKDFRNMFISKQPNLFFLDACSTGESHYYSPSIAFNLYKDFTNSSVIANLTSVSDREATEGAKYFYKSLIDKKSLAELLSENRRRLSNDWWKTIIFTANPEEVLFNVKEKSKIKKQKKILKIDDIDRVIKSYVYRYDIIRNVSDKLEEEDTNYLAFYGIGGIGKTYLMKYFSWFYSGRFENIFYFDLKEEGINSPTELLYTISEVLYDYEKIDDDLMDELDELKEKNEKRFLRKWFKNVLNELDGKTLLILDNLEEIG